jgi:hypothetical protein
LTNEHIWHIIGNVGEKDYVTSLGEERMTAMRTITVPQITDRLQRLPADKLIVVHDFVSYLVERQPGKALWNWEATSESFQVMLASEPVLRRDWEKPEEEIAWAHL